MTAREALWDARCLLCGWLVGQVVETTFVHDPNCNQPVRVLDGRVRCCRCGGSLLTEPTTIRLTRTIAARTPLSRRSK